MPRHASEDAARIEAMRLRNATFGRIWPHVTSALVAVSAAKAWIVSLAGRIA